MGEINYRQTERSIEKRLPYSKPETRFKKIANLFEIYKYATDPSRAQERKCALSYYSGVVSRLILDEVWTSTLEKYKISKLPGIAPIMHTKRVSMSFFIPNKDANEQLSYCFQGKENSDLGIIAIDFTKWETAVWHSAGQKKGLPMGDIYKVLDELIGKI